MSAPARVFGLVARAAPVAVLFRRGPAKQVMQLRWHLDSDRIEDGQWLKHRVFSRRCDLAPDGRHLIYFAGYFKPDPITGGSYTAIGRPPCFTALALYPWGSAWNGGGLFLDNRSYWVDDSGPRQPGEYLVKGTGLKRRPRPPHWITPRMGEDAELYLPRLVRDGWTLRDTESEGGGYTRTDRWLLERPVAPGWTLRKTFTASLVDRGPSGEIFWETHALSGPAGEVALDDDWAEIWDGEVLLARRGVLQRFGPGSEVREIADLNDRRFAARAAPYRGLDLHRPTRRRPWHPLDGDRR